MIMVLIFTTLYVALSVWDLVRVNDLLAAMVDPGSRKRSPAEPPPAPRLVLNPPATSQLQL